MLIKKIISIDLFLLLSSLGKIKIIVCAKNNLHFIILLGIGHTHFRNNELGICMCECCVIVYWFGIGLALQLFFFLYDFLVLFNYFLILFSYLLTFLIEIKATFLAHIKLLIYKSHFFFYLLVFLA